MPRSMLTGPALAAVLAMAAGAPALGQGGDFLTWQKNFGTTPAKKSKRAVGASQSVTVGGAQSPGARRSPARIKNAPTRKKGAGSTYTNHFHCIPSQCQRLGGQLQLLPPW